MNTRASWNSRGHRVYLGVAALLSIVWLATLGSRPLFDPDEGRYAEISREMLAGDSWIIPHLDGLAYIEKPPLQYWASAVSLRLFGHSALSARLYTALCALATVVWVWMLGLRLGGQGVAWRGAAVLSSMALFVVMGQLLTLDMSLTCWMTLSLSAFLMAQPVPGKSHRRVSERGWMLVAWAAAALGVMTKGLEAAVIPAAVLVLYSVYTRDYSPWRRLHAWLGLPLFLAVSVPWFWLAQRRLPDFAAFFFIHEHVSRYLTPSAHREAPWWFFGVVFVLGSMPWTLPAVGVVAGGWRRRVPSGQFDPLVFLWIWAVFIGVFFSLSDSKLIPYLLPAMPAVALLVAASSPAVERRDAWMTSSLTLIAAVALASCAVLAPAMLAPTERNACFALLRQPFLEVAVLLAGIGLFTLLRQGRPHGLDDPTRAAVSLGAGWCLAGILLMRAASVVAPIYSGSVLAAAGMGIPRGSPVYSVATYDQTLPFYWQRPMTLVAYRGELDFGLNHAAQPAQSVAQFVVDWRKLTEGYAVMERGTFDYMRQGGVPMRELARDLNRVLVARR